MNASLSQPAAEDAARRGVIAALIAFTTWGIYPIFYHHLAVIEPMQVLAWRILWSCAVMALLFIFVPRLTLPWEKLRVASTWLWILIATVLISINWFIFIYAVSTGEILQASLGYFLNPTVSALIGILFFGERLARLKKMSIAVALIGMTITFLVAGVVPVLALSMAAAFAVYAAVRKRSALDSASGLYLETLVLVPAGIAYLWLMPLSQQTFEPRIMSLLAVSGILTIIPLLTVVYAAKRIPLSTLGLFQYITPVMHLFIAVLIYGEVIDLSRKLAFATTLVAVALFVGAILQERQQEKSQRQTA